jgi:hypothetical protein
MPGVSLRVGRWIAPALLIPLLLAPGHARAQSTAVGGDSSAAARERAATRGPRFLLAVGTRYVPVDIRRVSVLHQHVSLAVDDVGIREALAIVAEQSGLPIAYSDDVVPAGARVRLHATDIPVAAALTAILLDANVDVVLTTDGHAGLVKRVPRQTGAVTGTVRDAATGEPVVGATVSLDGTRLGAISGDSGQYGIADVPPGTYTVRVRRLGYGTGVQSVTVVADNVARADFALAKVSSPLDEVVVTGTIAPTALKEVPSPISVIKSADIERYHIRQATDAIRLMVPGAVVWERGSQGGEFQDMSSRGISSLGTIYSSGPKVYVDGIETTVRYGVTVDPESIERIEMVRGPQAAALYGSDATGGVIQIFTKRGGGNASRPEVTLESSIGRIESDVGRSGALRLDNSLALAGQSGTTTYRLSAAYRKMGDWLPGYRETSPSAHGQIRMEQGKFSLGLFGRLDQQHYEPGSDPRLATVWPAVFGVPSYLHFDYNQEAYGAQLEYRASS